MSDADPMDQRLREYAARWRDAGEPPPAVDADRLPTRSATRAWWAAAVAAAAVAAGIGVGTTLAGHDDVATPPKQAHTLKPSDVVPWAPLPATHPTIPTDTTPPSPDPAEAVGKPRCRASDLRATGDVGGAAGTTYLTVRLALTGNEPCRLQGYPDLQLLDQGRLVDVPLQHKDDDSVYRLPVLVAPEHPASLQLSWGSSWCTTPVHNDTIHLILDGGFVSVPGFGSSPFCNASPGSGPTPILVDTFRPVRTRDAEARSPYAEVQVDGDLDLTASPEDAVPFTVTLTSPNDLPLDPCPDYRILQSGDVGPQTESYALNCAAVPFKDSSGRPYLPSGTPVRFAMTTASDGPGTYKLTWVLDTVDQKGVGGTLTVTAPTASSATTEPTESAQQKAALREGVRTIQAFLDTWRRDGIVVASRAYSVADEQTSSAAGTPTLSSGTVRHATIWSWKSPDRFTLEVSLDLLFRGDAMAWNQGDNDRFVTLTRTDGGYRLSFASSP